MQRQRKRDTEARTDNDEHTEERETQRETDTPRLAGGMHWSGLALLPPRAPQTVFAPTPSYLVTKDLDLADGSVHQALGTRAAVIGVDLQV